MPHEIYILGLGSVGILVAHALASIPLRPQFTVLLPRATSGNTTRRRSVDLELLRDGLSNIQEQVYVEDLPQTWYSTREPKLQSSNGILNGESEITCLIVTLKPNFVAETLQRLKHRLSRRSTILFLQNGMGVTDEVDREVFPNPETRPFYLTGVNWNATRRIRPFCATHIIVQSLYYGPSLRIPATPRYALPLDGFDAERDLPESARFLISKLDETRGVATLNPSFLGPDELIAQQLWKLSCNTMFNPLTALGNCTIGTVLARMPRLVADIAQEISEVYLSLPWSEKVEAMIKSDYSYRRLVERLYEHGNEYAKLRTSMWHDVQNSVDTEINYLTGYIVAVGKTLNVSCRTNEMVLEIVTSLRKEDSKETVNTVIEGQQMQKRVAV